MSNHSTPPPPAHALADALYERTRADVLDGRGTPLSTYRVQFHQGFTFRHALEVAPYLARLGVTDLYASPYLAASPGSTHGYDVVDHQRLNPEVGTEADHAALSAALERLGLGQVLDVVPNHMGIEAYNRLWYDVLENGPSSRYAKFFDVDWEPVKGELTGKVLLPVLGDQYGVVLEKGELKLRYHPEEGVFRVHYWEKALPVAPRQYRLVLAHALGALRAERGEEADDVVELESILTALEHLPERTDTARARMVERAREKEVVKRRLAALTRQSPAALAQVERAVEHFNGRPGDAASFDALHALLEGGSYRLAHWRVAGEEINYRRFFDINALAAIRMEEPEVFDETHALVFRWLRERKVTGLRIDHPDGLFDPTAYFLQLQQRYFVERARALWEAERGTDDGAWAEVQERLGERWWREVVEEAGPDHPLRKALYVVVEKIQGGKERIPESWAVHGTTGYRFANALSGVFVDASAERAMSETYHRFIEAVPDFEQLVFDNKLLIMRVSMASEMNMLAHELNRISEMSRRTRDFTLNALRRALVDFVALFPVYRTYVDGWRPELDARDVHYIEWTISQARARNPNVSPSLFDFLEDILLRRYPSHATEVERAVMLRFAMKLQQVTGPVMAKGLEDTVFYVYNRLASLNEVGGEPERFGTPPEVFHTRNQERAEHWPAAQLTSSTHDTKRSEDVRARLNVLTEVPLDWRAAVRRWARANRRHLGEVKGERAPSANDEYLFYQTVVGAWPMGDVGPEHPGWEDFRRRVREYMAKAIKEAKVHTSWTNPDQAYDEAMARFVDACLDPRRGAAFLEEARAFKRRIERAGQHNSLGQVLLKLGSPGAVDTYQGCELWDLSLVDPDNRRPVDFTERARLLDALDQAAERDAVALCRELTGSLDDGRAKLYLLSRGLRLRQRRAALFRGGGYRALELTGPRGHAALGLLREREQEVVIACAPRYTLAALETGWVQSWRGTRLVLPEAYADMTFRDVFTGRSVHPERGAEGATLPLGPLLDTFPVVLLERGEG